jgi:Bacteriophage head to tail connecting protein
MATAYAPSAFLDTPGPVAASGDTEAHRLLQRHSELLSQRTLYDHIWQDQIELMLPGAADITHFRTPGASRTDRLFDTTAIQASQTLAANLMGAVTNQAITWAQLAFREALLKDNQAVSTWLHQIDTIMMAAYNASNFYQAAHTFYLNLCIFGTAAMYVGSMSKLGATGDEEVYLRFRTLSTGHYCIAENAHGRVDTVFRSFRLTPRQARQQFGEVALSSNLRECCRDPKEMDRPKKFLHCVYPREDYVSGRLGSKNMPYIERYIECETQHICARSGYEEFPYLVSRWETVDEGPWGFGPGHMALPDVRTLNTLRELMLLQLQLWVQPPLMAMEEAVIGAISLESLAVNTITQADALRPMELGGHPDQVRLEEATLQKAIRDLFFADALSGLPPAEASAMTAFEVAQRIELMQRMMGPAFTRLLSEMLDPLADRVFGILWRANVLPPPPREVLEAAARNQGQLDVEYVGPLARAQRGAEVKAIGEALAVLGQIVGLTQDPSVMDNLDFDAAWRAVADANGTPRHLIRDTAQVEQMRRIRAEQQAMLAEQQAQAQQAENLKNSAPMVRAVQPMMAGAA